METKDVNPFFGTSAAAAIATLLIENGNVATPSEIRTALTTTILDIEAVGCPR